MNLSYSLPRELIAQTPRDMRDEARLLVLYRSTGRIRHTIFREIINLLDERHLLVLNNTKVFPARLSGRHEGGGKVEILLVREREPSIWEVIGRPVKRLKKGCAINFDHGHFTPPLPAAMRFFCREEGAGFKALVLEDGYRKLLKFEFSGSQFRPERIAEGLLDMFFEYGRSPLPPYIKRPHPGSSEELDRVRYQTVYAKSIGSCACPTAGLHFTQELLSALKTKGIETAEITLHVGPGTFRPIKTVDLERHHMEEEFFSISSQAAQSINSARKKGKIIVAVGTSTVRALEQASPDHEVFPMEGNAGIFICPGYRFKIVNTLVTNFHQPNSSPLAMVTAFGGAEFISRAYKDAIKHRYRFLSYGDSMLII